MDLDCEKIILRNIKKHIINGVSTTAIESYLKKLQIYFEDKMVINKGNTVAVNYKYSAGFLNTINSTPSWHSWIKTAEVNTKKKFKMNNKMKVRKHNFLWALFNHKCPHCREGNMFQDNGSYHLKSFMKMNEKCPVCGQKTEIEKGFYYGTGYVSYALTVAFSVSTFVAWWVLIGISVDDNRVFWWMGTNAVLMILLQPYFMRLSRAVWLSFFLKYNANWKTEHSKIAAV